MKSLCADILTSDDGFNSRSTKARGLPNFQGQRTDFRFNFKEISAEHVRSTT